MESVAHKVEVIDKILDDIYRGDHKYLYITVDNKHVSVYIDLGKEGVYWEREKAIDRIFLSCKEEFTYELLLRSFKSSYFVKYSLKTSSEMKFEELCKRLVGLLRKEKITKLINKI